MRDPAELSAHEVLEATGIYRTFGEYLTPIHDADKVRRFEDTMNAMIVREDFDEDEFVGELRRLLSDRIIELEMTENWRLL